MSMKIFQKIVTESALEISTHLIQNRINSVCYLNYCKKIRKCRVSWPEVHASAVNKHITIEILCRKKKSSEFRKAEMKS